MGAELRELAQESDRRRVSGRGGAVNVRDGEGMRAPLRGEQEIQVGRRSGEAEGL